jgi:TQXA domain-containing protein/LPXTG-motif cell wall-anchored protein
MLFARRRVATRLAATAVATGLFTAGAIAVAGTATADENPWDGGATAVLDGLSVSDEVDVVIDGEEHTYGAGLFNLTGSDGSSLQTYCIDFLTGAQNGTQYKETGWDSSTLHDNPDAGKIQWILENSYPSVDVAALAGSAGVDSLTPETAAAGTQAAIWGFSDGVEAVPQDENAAALAEWLSTSAEAVEEPGASLELSPREVSGTPGSLVGPVTVNTSSESVTVTPDAASADQGVQVVDADGNVITADTPVTDGTELFFDVPEGADPGAASFDVTASSTVPVGRAFTGVDTITQTMILAGSTDSSVTATATGRWAVGPSPSITADEVCAEGGVEITATNNGDETYTFTLAGEEHEVAPGDSASVVFPVEDQQPYEIVIENPIGDNWTFTGVLDCSTEGDTPDGPNAPEPASTGGAGGAEEAEDDVDLAETGSSNSPAMIGGIALALLVAGGGALFFMRRRAATVSAGSED